jgi:hypothetical protein
MRKTSIKYLAGIAVLTAMVAVGLLWLQTNLGLASESMILIG